MCVGMGMLSIRRKPKINIIIRIKRVIIKIRITI